MGRQKESEVGSALRPVETVNTQEVGHVLGYDCAPFVLRQREEVGVVQLCRVGTVNRSYDIVTTPTQLVCDLRVEHRV